MSFKLYMASSIDETISCSLCGTVVAMDNSLANFYFLKQLSNIFSLLIIFKNPYGNFVFCGNIRNYLYLLF